MINVLYFLVFSFGACLGSFMNVVIYRLPLGLSVATPRSRCPGCDKLIYWFENIPVISFIFLKAKCSKCKVKISWRYPAVEVLCGLVSLIFFMNVNSASGIYFYAFNMTIFLIFLAQFVIDIEHKRLPDSLNIYLALVLFAFSIMSNSWQYVLLGGLLGGGFPLLITWIFYKLRGQVGLGGGDIKLYGALGLYLGPTDAMSNIFLSCFLGAIFGVTLIAFKKIDKSNPIPFGPFILIVASVQIFFPELYAQVKLVLF